MPGLENIDKNFGPITIISRKNYSAVKKIPIKTKKKSETNLINNLCK